MRKSKPAAGEVLVIAAVFLFLLFAGVVESAAFKTVAPQKLEPEKLTLIAGKSIVLKGNSVFNRISSPDENIANALALSPTEIYVSAKSPGITNLILWQDKKLSAVYDIEVRYDISRLKEALYDNLPNETNLKVTASKDGITLTGRVSNQENLATAMALAEAFIPDKDNGVVNNQLEVGGIHQVMLEVRVAEMATSTAKRLGINFGYESTSNFGLTMLGQLIDIVPPTSAEIGLGQVGLVTSPALNGLFRFGTGSVTWTAFVDAMQEDGLVKVLAEPTLIAMSGQTASFLAGGEFPIPIPQGLGTVAIEFKEFGVGLVFTPTVINENKINIRVAPEVSELDFTIAAQISGFLVPGLDTRKASTVVELGDGQSFAIAGLLSETHRTSIKKYPFLGDIPILGILFRSTQFQKSETELVIIVTPHLVKPLEVAKQTLPTDFYVEPNDIEFYLEGMMIGRERKKPMEPTVRLDGEFGHALPGEEAIFKGSRE